MTARRSPGNAGAQRPLAAALAYAARGWAVFPLHSILSGRCSCRRDDCPHPAKHPLARHGLHDATTDEVTIRSWWDRRPWANIGVATGAPSGIVVIDVDPRSGGHRSLTRLERTTGPLPATLTARTGGGGLHLVYAHPGGDIRNTAGRLPGVTGTLPGIDLRADGGYIVAAPSRHRSGQWYCWIDPDTALAAAPRWLRQSARRPSRTRSIRRNPQWEAPTRYLAALDAELSGLGQAVVLARDAACEVLAAVTCAPITRTVRSIRSEVPVGPSHGLPAPSVISCDNVLTVPKADLDAQPVGRLDDVTRAALDRALRYALDIVS